MKNIFIVEFVWPQRLKIIAITMPYRIAWFHVVSFMLLFLPPLLK